MIERLNEGIEMTRLLATIQRTLLALVLGLLMVSPSHALFLQADWWDPTKPGVGPNRYAYSHGDPVNFSDPSGHQTDTDDDDIDDVTGAPIGDLDREIQRPTLDFGPATWAGAGAGRIAAPQPSTAAPRATTSTAQPSVAGVQPTAPARTGASRPATQEPKTETGMPLGDFIGRVREALQRTGNFNVGTATRAQADEMGRAFVGPGARPTTNGTGITSETTGRSYRGPADKPNAPAGLAPTGVQANMTRTEPVPGKGTPVQVGNAHIDIVD